MRYAKRTLLVSLQIASMLMVISSASADGDFVWAKGMGGSGTDIGRSIAVDSAGNVYTSGSFTDTADFDPGASTYNLTGGGGFVSKLDFSGNFLWAKQSGGVGGSIAVDSDGNVCTTGTLSGTVDFDPGPGTYNLTETAEGDIFVSKLDSSGNFVWAKRLGGSGVDRSRGIGVDSAGNVYATGYFTGAADFDPGAGTHNLTSSGGYDIFVSKLDPNGEFVWAKRVGGTDDQFGYGIAVDNADNVCIQGSFEGTVDFDPGPGTYELTQTAYSTFRHIFVLKLDSAGNFVWAGDVGGSSSITPGGIAVDGTGNVYTTGDFYAIMDFDPGPGTHNVDSDGRNRTFVSKLDSSGDFVWACAVGASDGEGNSVFGRIDVDASGNVYTTDIFKGTEDFDPGPDTYNLTATRTPDNFVLKLDSGGSFVWVRSARVTPSLTLDNAGNVYTTGYFANSVDFDPGPGAYNLTSNGARDIFVLKLSGLGGEGEIAVDPSYILFPDQAIGDGPTTATTISAENTGISDLSITSVSKTGTGAPHFVISSDTGQAVLSPGQERLIGVAFNPYSAGDKSGYITIGSSDPTNPVVDISLWGHAYLGPEIDVTPFSWTWPYQSIPAAPAMPGAVTITNTGGPGLSLSSVALAGTNPGQFLITDDTGQTSLAASQSRLVDVAFNPTTPGEKTAYLRITSNDADEPTVNVSLTGTGFDPAAGYTTPVWVDPAYNGIEQGTETQPYNTVAEACALVLTGGTVKLKPGACDEIIRIAKPVRIEANGDVAIIGAPTP